MKALTLHQPWASLIAVGAKTIETRPWSTGYRGALAIHAGASIPWTVRRDVLGHAPRGQTRRHFAGDARILDALYGVGLEPFAQRDGEDPDYTSDGFHALPLGAVVASARLVDVVPTEEIVWNDVRGVMGDPLGWWGFGSRLGTPQVRSNTYVVQERERPFGDFSPGQFAWLLADVAPTTERCPWCWGAQWFPVTDPHLDAPDSARIVVEVTHEVDWPYERHGMEWCPDPCPVCEGAGRCDPVPARGKQGLWDWTPEDCSRGHQTGTHQ